MKISLSYRNQARVNGALERFVWGFREDGSARALGVAAKTRDGRWEASCDDLKGGRRSFEGRTLEDLSCDLRAFYA